MDVIAGRSQATDIHGIVSDGSACWPFLLSVGYWDRGTKDSVEKFHR